jgi:soluble lytic murein transglycosylase
MPRAATTTLVCVTLLGLSCELSGPGGASLPAVSAPPAVAAAPPAHNPEVTRLVEAVASHIAAQRRSSLVESEIATVARTIVEESRRYGIDPSLVLAVIHVESRYDAYAVSPVGAMGLMQILPSTGEELAAKEGVAWRGPQSLFDPVVNVRLGLAYLNELTDRYDDTRMALAAYNWGPGHIDRRLRRGVPMPKVYPALVLDAYTAQQQRSS